MIELGATSAMSKPFSMTKWLRLGIALIVAAVCVAGGVQFVRQVAIRLIQIPPFSAVGRTHGNPQSEKFRSARLARASWLSALA